MNATTGGPSFDEYSVQYLPAGLPSLSQPLSLRTCSIDNSCKANFTIGSFWPATCSTGLGFCDLKSRRSRKAAIGATAANVSPRAAHSTYVKKPPLEWPVE